MKKDISILLVDDEVDLTAMLKKVFSFEGYSCITASSGQEALDTLKQYSVQLVITDINMPGMDGVSLLRNVKEFDPDIEVIMLTGFASVETAVAALSEGKAFGYITKPLENLETFFHTVDKALENRRLRLENRSLIQQLKDANVDLEQRIQERTTELTESNESLLEARQKAEQASIAQRNFIAGASHEFKTPLTAVLGFSQLLFEAQGISDEKVKEYAAYILENGDRLLHLVEDVLQFAQLDITSVTLDYKSILLEPFFTSCFNMIAKRAEEKGVGIELRVPDSLVGVLFSGDEHRLRYVLFHLLDNALKNTPKGGGIVLGAELTENERCDDDAPLQLVFYVTDTGVGLRADMQKKIFEPFFQVRSGLTDKDSGVGLGLTLARRFMELHGGCLKVKSSPGAGAVFSCVLPLKGTGITFPGNESGI